MLAPFKRGFVLDYVDMKLITCLKFSSNIVQLLTSNHDDCHFFSEDLPARDVGGTCKRRVRSV